MKTWFAPPVLGGFLALTLGAQTINPGRLNLPTESSNSVFVLTRNKTTKERLQEAAARKQGEGLVVPEKEAAPPPGPTAPQRQAEPDSPPPSALPSGELSSGETLAAVFQILQLPPPFESAGIRLVTPTRILLCDPNGYTGSMGPWTGEVTWSTKGKEPVVEKVEAPKGYVVVKWPSSLGSADQAAVVVRASRPVIALESWWSDSSLFGSDIPKLLVKVAPNWAASPRRLPIQRFGYRETLLPSTVPDGLRHPLVGPVLKPFLLRAGKTESDLQKIAAGGK